MTQYKVGDVAALFSKPKTPTSESGKKLQSLFNEFYNKKSKSPLQSSQKETSDQSTTVENKETGHNGVSKKRKFSDVNDSESKIENNSPKKSKKTFAESKSFKNTENKKDKMFMNQDFPRKKKKRHNVNSFNPNNNFLKSEVNDSSENNIESPSISKFKKGPKGNKQKISFIKKSKHQISSPGNDNCNRTEDEISENVPSKASFNITDSSIREEIKEFLKSNSKKSKKMKSASDDFKKSSQDKVFNKKVQDKVSKLESKEVLSNTFASTSPSENKYELNNSSKDREVPDFIRKPKRKNKPYGNNFGKSDDKKFQTSNNEAIDNTDTLFKSENIQATNFKKQKFNDNNHMQNSFPKTSEAPDFIKLSDTNPNDEETLSRTIFIGNLPVNTTKKALTKLFSPFGPIEHIRYHGVETDKAKIFSKNPSKSLNTNNYAADSVPGFIVFKERKSAVEALSLSGTVFKEHHITVDFAVPAGTHKIYDDKRSIFIGNLPFDIKDESIWNAFMLCGRIEGVRVVRDHKTGIGKGFGYVLFSTVQAKDDALALEDLEIDGRKIRIKAVDSNKKTQKKTDSPTVRRDTFKSRAIKFKKSNKSPGSRKSIKKIMKKEKTLHKKKKIASILQKSMKS